MNCPDCHAQWPYNLTMLRDAYEASTFDVHPDGSITLGNQDILLFDEIIYQCNGCYNNYPLPREQQEELEQLVYG